MRDLDIICIGKIFVGVLEDDDRVEKLGLVDGYIYLDTVAGKHFMISIKETEGD